MLGIEYQGDKLILNPLLSHEEENISFTLRYLDSQYTILIDKPKGFYRLKDFNYSISLDGDKIETNEIKLTNDGKNHEVQIRFY